jgi:hypothetical protein
MRKVVIANSAKPTEQDKPEKKVKTIQVKTSDIK